MAKSLSNRPEERSQATRSLSLSQKAASLPGRAFRRWLYRCDVQIALARDFPVEIRLPRGSSRLVARALNRADLDHLHTEFVPQRAAFHDNLATGLEGFAALDGGQVVAVCWFARHQEQDPKRLQFHFRATQIYTFSLAVATPYRRTGIAASLQWQAWAHYSAAGFSELIRLVSLENTAALKLHLHMGFRPCGRGRRLFHVLGRRFTREFDHEPGRFDDQLPWRHGPGEAKPVAKIDFEWIATEEKFQALAPQWQQLCDRARTHSLSRGFVWQWAAWTHVAAPRGCLLRLLVGRVDNRVVLILPLVREGIYLRFLSSEKFEYRDVLVEDAAQADTWVAAVLAEIRALRGPACLDLRDILASSTLGRAFATLETGGLRRIDGSPIIRLDRFAASDDYSRHLPAHMVADQRRQWRRLARLPGGFAFRIAAVQEIEPMVDWIFTHKLRWATERQIQVGVFDSDGYRRFIKSVLGDAMTEGRAMLCCIDGEPGIASAGFGFIHDDRFVFYAFAYDNEYASLSPSRLLLESLIGWCLDQKLSTFDFLPGNEAYKRIWADDTLPVIDVLLALNLRGRFRLSWSRRAFGWVVRSRWLRSRYDLLPPRQRARLRKLLLADWDRVSSMHRAAVGS